MSDTMNDPNEGALTPIPANDPNKGALAPTAAEAVDKARPPAQQLRWTARATHRAMVAACSQRTRLAADHRREPRGVRVGRISPGAVGSPAVPRSKTHGHHPVAAPETT
jgi:NAD(P)-dependent dehydrogenase (short-subunit alcohol dehydrogenase family)